MGKLVPTGNPSLGRVDMNIHLSQTENLRTQPTAGASQPGSSAALIHQLRDRIRQVETAGRLADDNRISSGCRAIDRLLPDGGYSRGSLVQWITAGGAGADFLSLLVARQACEDGGALVVIDPQNQFYPPAAAALGIKLDNLIVLQAGNQVSRHSPTTTPPMTQSVLPDDSSTAAGEKDLLWAIDQSLRCPAVAAVWGPLETIDERWFRRFQLSAESSGCLGLFIQPLAAARQPTWAEIQWLVAANPAACEGHARHESLSSSHTNDPRSVLTNPSPLNACQSRHPSPASQPQQPISLQLTRCRGTHTGKTIQLTINHITGDVQPAPRNHETLRSTNTNEAQPPSPHASARAVSLAAKLAHPTTGRQRA